MEKIYKEAFRLVCHAHLLQSNLVYQDKKLMDSDGNWTDEYKGMKEEYKKLAEQEGLSLNKLIVNLLEKHKHK